MMNGHVGVGAGVLSGEETVKVSPPVGPVSEILAKNIVTEIFLYSKGWNNISTQFVGDSPLENIRLM